MRGSIKANRNTGSLRGAIVIISARFNTMLGQIFIDLNFLIYPIFLFVGIVLGLFLFWRACRHELIDSDEAFDFILVGALGAVLFSRLFYLFFHNPIESWSIERLVFFNKYGGFDYWGALVGAIVAFFLYLRLKKINLWSIFDLAAAPLAFSQFIISVGSFLSERTFVINKLALISAVGYFVVFILLKRLAARKRHTGFFISFYLVSISLVELMVFKFKTDLYYFGQVPYELAAPVVVLTISLANWYELAKRNLKGDLKQSLGLVLLFVFALKRIISSVDEAGKISKLIIFSPYYSFKALLIFLITLVKEARQGFAEFLYVLGIKKFYRR